MLYLKNLVEIAKDSVIDSIWRSVNLGGKGTLYVKVKAILEDEEVETCKSEVILITNLKKAWDFLLDNLSYNNSFMLLREFNKIVVGDSLHGAGELRKVEIPIRMVNYVAKVPVEEEVYDSIVRLNEIEDAELKALKYFCYVARTKIFTDRNLYVASLVANKILIENDIGIFRIPINMVHKFRMLLLKFYGSNDDKELIKFIRKNCIYRIKEEEKEKSCICEDIREFLFGDLSADEDKIYKEASVKISKSMDFSSGQLGVFSLILSKLVRIYRGRGVSSCYLYSGINGTPFLRIDSQYGMMVREYVDMPEKLQKEIDSVVDNLSNYVTVPIHGVRFSTDKDLFSCGCFIASEQEGYMDIVLK